MACSSLGYTRGVTVRNALNTRASSTPTLQLEQPVTQSTSGTENVVLSTRGVYHAVSLYQAAVLDSEHHRGSRHVLVRAPLSTS